MFVISFLFLLGLFVYLLYSVIIESSLVKKKKKKKKNFANRHSIP